MSRFRLTITILAVLYLCGCVTVKSYNYQAESPRGGPPLTKQSAIVVPFQDSRPGVNRDRTALALIPLVPFGELHYDSPESLPNIGGNLMVENPKEEFAKNLAQELNAAGIFSEAFFGHRPSDSRYLIRGTLEKTPWNAAIYTYCLSFVGIYTWFLGLPAGSYQTEVAIQYDCIDNENGKILFSKSYQSPQRKKRFWIYASERRPEYDAMLKEINMQFIKDFRATLE